FLAGRRGRSSRRAAELRIRLRIDPVSSRMPIGWPLREPSTTGWRWPDLRVHSSSRASEHFGVAAPMPLATATPTARMRLCNVRCRFKPGTTDLYPTCRLSAFDRQIGRGHRRIVRALDRHLVRRGGVAANPRDGDDGRVFYHGRPKRQHLALEDAVRTVAELDVDGARSHCH